MYSSSKACKIKELKVAPFCRDETLPSQDFQFLVDTLAGCTHEVRQVSITERLKERDLFKHHVVLHGDNSYSGQARLFWFSIGVGAVPDRASILPNISIDVPLRGSIVKKCAISRGRIREARGLH